MIETLRQYVSRRPVAIPVVIAAFINIFLYFLLFFQIRPVTTPIPLHFNIYYGIDFIGRWYYVYALPISGSIILLLNMWIGAIMEKKKEEFSFLILIATIVVQTLLFLAGVFIVLLNI